MLARIISAFADEVPLAMPNSRISAISRNVVKEICDAAMLDQNENVGFLCQAAFEPVSLVFVVSIIF